MLYQFKSLTIPICIAIILATIPTTTSALPQTQSQSQHRFTGNAMIDGVVAPGGTVVSAWIDGMQVTKPEDTRVASDGAFVVVVRQPDGANYAGKTVQFRLGMFFADQVAEWEEDGETDSLNLAASSNKRQALEILKAGDKTITVQVFATLVGLMIPGVAFMLTVISALEQRLRGLDIVSRPSDTVILQLKRLQNLRDGVIEGAVSWITALFVFSFGLLVAAGFDSWGEEAFNAAILAGNEALAYGLEIGETAGGGIGFMGGIGLLAWGAKALIGSLNALRTAH
jgi:hypothetical protein